MIKIIIHNNCSHYLKDTSTVPDSCIVINSLDKENVKRFAFTDVNYEL